MRGSAAPAGPPASRNPPGPSWIQALPLHPAITKAYSRPLLHPTQTLAPHQSLSAREARARSLPSPRARDAPPAPHPAERAALTSPHRPASHLVPSPTSTPGRGSPSPRSGFTSAPEPALTRARRTLKATPPPLPASPSEASLTGDGGGGGAESSPQRSTMAPGPFQDPAHKQPPPLSAPPFPSSPDFPDLSPASRERSGAAGLRELRAGSTCPTAGWCSDCGSR